MYKMFCLWSNTSRDKESAKSIVFDAYFNSGSQTKAIKHAARESAEEQRALLKRHEKRVVAPQ